MFVNALLIVSLVFVEVINAHDSYGSILAEQLNQYCALHVGGGKGVSNRSKPHEHRIGKAGPPGVAGPRGAIGRQGFIGPAGSAGPSGPAGSTGPAGSAGHAGPVGPTGPAGPQGPGVAGPRGAIGRQGFIGPAGPQGPSGVKGSPGVVDYDKVDEMMTKKIQSIISPGCSRVPQWFEKLLNWTVLDIYTNDYQSGTEIYCDFKTDGGGWTVFQRRSDGSINFARNWNEYVNGFGNLEGEFWMGLEKLHRLTSGEDLELRFDLEDWEGNTAYAVYSTFSIGDASTKYRLSIGGYSGTAGDGMTSSYNNMMFSTYDADNDTSGSTNCALDHMGGWWFFGCNVAFLNGLYLHGSYKATHDYGIGWGMWKSGTYSLKSTEMKFRPKL